MADPTRYTPGFNYSGWESDHPTEPKPGAQLDNDFANIERSVAEIIEALSDVRRSDGAVQNNAVGFDALHPAVKAAIAGAEYDYEALEDFLVKSSNLKDLPDKEAALQNLGGPFLTRADNLADLENPQEARDNLGVVNPLVFETVAELLAGVLDGRELSYAEGANFLQVAPGDLITARGFRYEVAPPDETDAGVETDGGVKLYALPGSSGEVSVLQFFDGGGDATQAFQKALDSGWPVVVPNTGTAYELTGSLSSTGKQVIVRGVGRPELRWTANGGFNMQMGPVSASESNRLEMRHLKLTTTLGGGGKAVQVDYRGGVGTQQYPVILEDVQIFPAPGSETTAWWDKGVEANNVRQAAFRDVVVRGASGSGGSSEAMLAGIHLTDNSTETPVEIVFDRCAVYFGDVGFDIGDLETANHEGIYISSCISIASRVGVRFRTYNPSPWLTIVGSHFSNREFGVETEYIAQITVSNCNFTPRNESSHDYVALKMRSPGGNAVVHGNTFRGSSEGALSTTGIDSNLTRTIIVGNTFGSFDKGVRLGSGALDSLVLANVFSGCVVDVDSQNPTSIVFNRNGDYLDLSSQIGLSMDGVPVIDGNRGLRFRAYSENNLADITNPVNTHNKGAGKGVWDTTNNRPLWASGSDPASVWRDGTGTVQIQPA